MRARAGGGIDGGRLDALAMRLRAEHPELEPLDLDADMVRTLAGRVGASDLGDDEMVTLTLAWEHLIP